MNEQYYLHEGDAVIDRNSNDCLKRTALCDEEGTPLYFFPENWSDDQIRIALRFANQLFAKGVERGKWLKAYEVKASLGIKEPS